MIENKNKDKVVALCHVRVHDSTQGFVAGIDLDIPADDVIRHILNLRKGDTE